ncbi:hypothetical protein V2J09_007282, partial [Rumex salicifolius]
CRICSRATIKEIHAIIKTGIFFSAQVLREVTTNWNSFKIVLQSSETDFIEAEFLQENQDLKKLVLQMQLYHHPISMDSQKVRLALEENDIDYTSHHANPLTGKNLDPWLFKMNPSGRLPVFKNGSHIIYDTIEIIQYIERIALVSSGGGETELSSTYVTEWMRKIQSWNPKYFTLSHVPEKHRLHVTKFLRRVVIARMSEAPDLASAYHLRLKHAYETQEKLNEPDVVKHSKEHLIRLLDEVEAQLKETSYVAGDRFTMADVVLIPVLARLQLLKLEKEYIECRPNLSDYWNVVRLRPSCKKVIGKRFEGWRRQRMLVKLWCFVNARSLLRSLYNVLGI